MWSATISVAKRSACWRMRAIRPGPAGLDVAGPVVHIGRGHQLTALFQPGDQHGLAVGARGIDRGAVAGRARAQDDQLAVSGCALMYNFHDLQRPRTDGRSIDGK
jgi:hypothetical protein